jgi:hypothetical protein
MGRKGRLSSQQVPAKKVHCLLFFARRIAEQCVSRSRILQRPHPVIVCEGDHRVCSMLGQHTGCDSRALRIVSSVPRLQLTLTQTMKLADPNTFQFGSHTAQSFEGVYRASECQRVRRVTFENGVATGDSPHLRCRSSCRVRSPVRSIILPLKHFHQPLCVPLLEHVAILKCLQHQPSTRTLLCSKISKDASLLCCHLPAKGTAKIKEDGFASGSIRRSVFGVPVVRPDAEPPLVAADEVGVVVGDAERTRLFSYAFQRLRSAKPRHSPHSADFSQTRFFKELAAFARGEVGPLMPKPGERTSEGHPTADAFSWPLVSFAGCVARCTSTSLRMLTCV